MRNGEPGMFIGLSTLRNGYMQMQWSRVQMFLVFNTVVLPIVFGTDQSEAVKLVISIVGVASHVLLLNAVLRANGWTNLIDRTLVQLENLDKESEDGVRVSFFSSADFQKARKSWFASRLVFGTIGIAVIVLWIEESIRHGLLFFMI